MICRVNFVFQAELHHNGQRSWTGFEKWNQWAGGTIDRLRGIDDGCCGVVMVVNGISLVGGCDDTRN